MSYEPVVKEDSPKGYWRLGELSGTSAADASGNSLAGTYENAPTLGVTGALTGDANTAVTLNGTNQFIERSHNALLNVGDVFTFEAWVKRSENGRQDVILYKEGATKAAKMAITTGNKLQLRVPGVKTLAESTTEVKADGNWHHLVATKSGATIKLYIDGVDRTGTTENETCKNNEGALCIGAENPTEEFFKGSLDEVAYYSTALSKARVEAHFAAGAAEIFTLSSSGTSVSTFAETDELSMTETASGSSTSSFSETNEFTFGEVVNGESSSGGEETMAFEESIAMSVSGESISSGSSTDMYEALESISGSSSSSGEENETLEAKESPTGTSTSSGSEVESLMFVNEGSGTSASTFSETDEFLATETASGSSASIGTGTIDEAEADEVSFGSSTSSGTEMTELEYGEPSQPIISPVLSRRLLAVRWKFFLCDSSNMELLGEIKQARGKQLQLALNKPGGCNFNVPIDYDLFKNVEEVNHGIVAYRNKEARYSGMIWNIDEQTQGNTIAIQSVGWFETLNHRILREDIGYPPFSTGTITGGKIVFIPAQGTVGNVNYHPGGLLTIANAQQNSWIVEGSNKDVMSRIISYQKAQNIGQAITQLTEIEAGFDFAVDPLTRVMDLTNWNEVPDKTDSVVFGFNWGPNNIDTLGRQFDVSTMANRVTALGKYGGGFAEDKASQAKYQLFEEMPQLSEVADPNVLLGYAGGEVLLRSAPRILYSFQPFPYSGTKKVPQPFDDYDIGDKVSFTAIKKPRIEISGQDVRIYGMNIDISDEGNEKVSALQISP